MPHSQVWSHVVLTAIPIWVILACLIATLYVPIYAGRWILEGFPYNVSTSAMFGDAALTVYIILAAEVLKREPALPQWTTNASFNFICIFAGVAAFLTAPYAAKAMDQYHNWFIVPVMAYLIASTLPVVFLGGIRGEICASVGFFLVWGGFLWFDIHHHLLNQREWIINHGFGCILKK